MPVYESALGRDLYHEHIQGATPWLAQVNGIAATALGTTTLFTVPAGGKNLVIFRIFIRCTVLVAGRSIDAVFNLGGNSPNFTDLASGQSNAFTAINTYQIYIPASPGIMYTAATNFSLKVTTASNAPTETWAIDMIGYLV